LFNHQHTCDFCGKRFRVFRPIIYQVIEQAGKPGETCRLPLSQKLPGGIGSLRYQTLTTAQKRNKAFCGDTTCYGHR
ncbi:MAG: hypothetical protein LZF63_14255, partial [Nitrosomonas sp.]|nr:hypothetical protein [Nitrosomonas sp.]